MFAIETASRLHFGLLSLPQVAHASRPSGAASSRRFGGVGLMVQAPGIRLRVRPSSSWSAEGSLADRALALARQWTAGNETSACFHITVEACPAEHVGLGTGTQLGLATARVLAEALGQTNPDVAAQDAIALARRLGRGQRSALGVHGFARGGFLVDGGKGANTGIAPLLARLDFPEIWPILLVIPSGRQGTHGLSEAQAFAHLSTQRSALSVQTDALCRLVLLGMLPAVHERDFAAFGDALFEFNRRVGEMFRPLQGGTYASPQTEAVVDWLRNRGVKGVGQSSWGPTVFGVLEPAPSPSARSMELAQDLQQHFGLTDNEVILTTAANEGARAVG